MGSNIDKNSLTWKEIEKFIYDERVDAIASLIANDRSDHQRGIIEVLDRLSSLTDEEELMPVVSAGY